ncbi:MAG: hypothetical protein WBQ18_10490 [Solirubrobacteraceae bacterium]|jgi:cell division septation protein DedD
MNCAISAPTFAAERSEQPERVDVTSVILLNVGLAVGAVVVVAVAMALPTRLSDGGPSDDDDGGRPPRRSPQPDPRPNPPVMPSPTLRPRRAGIDPEALAGVHRPAPGGIGSRS